MRDHRIALKKNNIVSFGDGKDIVIHEEIGRGASCIVYDAAYSDDIGVQHNVRLKECYPNYLLINRNDKEHLVPSECNEEKFEAAKKKFMYAYKRNANIRNTFGLTNSTINPTEISSYNNTIYIKMELNEGTDYRKYEDQSLKELFTHIKSLAELIQKYHKNGYLYLDIKPENVFILPETEEHIILFDFDSVITLEELRKGNGIELSFSEGFSAPEQIQGAVDKIGEHTDIYSIGALVFYKLFRRTATSQECKISSIYHFEEMKYASEKYHPKLYRTLDTFFRKTLSIAIPPRWHDMQQVIHQLDELIELADIDKVYLMDSFQYDSACFVGRSEELEEMKAILSENQLLFLSGIGGIGKTELAKQYAYKYHSQYDTIIFSIFEKNIITLVCDEIILNKINRDENESDHDYFARKIKILKRIATPNDLIIIDNFDVDSDEKLELLFSCPCKFIVTTRMDFRDYNYRQINVGRIHNFNDILDLFYTYNHKNYSKEENEAIKQLIEYVDHHTMTVELIAKYLRNSEELPSHLYEKFLQKEGTANTGEIDIKQRKDRELRSKSVNDHLSILFDVSAFDNTEKEIIRSLSLLAGMRIEKSKFMGLCATENIENKLYFLIKNGWIEYNDTSEKISLHQVIQDLIYKNLKPNAANCPNIVNGMIQYVSSDVANHAENEIRQKVFQVFMMRLSGDNLPYAKLCLAFGEKDKLDEAEKICLGYHEAEAFDLLQKIYRKKIGILSMRLKYYDLRDEDEDDLSLEQELTLTSNLLDKMMLYCEKSSESLDYIVKEYIETGSDIGSSLTELNSYLNKRIPEIENIYSKIAKMFDVATEKLPSTSYSALEKEELYKEIQDFYSGKYYGGTYQDKNFSDLEKAYQYQELIDQLRKDTSEENMPEVINIPQLVRMQMYDLLGSDMAAEYEKEERYEEAIDYYKKDCDKDMELSKTAMQNISSLYFKTGDIDNGIRCLEQIIKQNKKSGIYFADVYIDLIGKLIAHKDFKKANKYAKKLIFHEKLNALAGNSPYSITYTLSAHYFLYLLEKNQRKKDILWQKCLNYYRMLGDNEIEKEIFDFITEYLNKENIAYKMIFRILDRIAGSYGKGCDIRLKIIQQTIRKYAGKKDFEKYHVIFLVKLAESLGEYPCEDFKKGKQNCIEAQRRYDIYKLNDRYIQNLIYKTKAELMIKNNEYESAVKIKKLCDFKLLAEQEILHHNYSKEEQVEIWRDAALQYEYTDNYNMIAACLVEALKVLRPIINQSEFSRFHGDYQDIMKCLIEAYINMGASESAYLALTELYNETIQYLISMDDSDRARESEQDEFSGISDNMNERVNYLTEIADYLAKISKNNEAVRTYLAAMYFSLTKKADAEILKIGNDVGKNITQLCEIINELLEQEADTDTIDSLVNLKDRMSEYRDSCSFVGETYESIITKISNRYQYQDIEFK